MGLAFSSEVGTSEEAFRECTDDQALEAAVVVADFLVRSAVAPTDDLLPVAAALLLRDGAVATAASERALEGRLAAAALAARDEQEVADLAPSLLLLDPALARARHRCVPSRLPEAAWWALYVDALLAAAGQQLPRLLRQERACGVLRELADAPLGGDGEVRPKPEPEPEPEPKPNQLSRLPTDALVRVACSLPAASVLSLGGASRRRRLTLTVTVTVTVTLTLTLSLTLTLTLILTLALTLTRRSTTRRPSAAAATGSAAPRCAARCASCAGS